MARSEVLRSYHVGTWRAPDTSAYARDFDYRADDAPECSAKGCMTDVFRSLSAPPNRTAVVASVEWRPKREVRVWWARVHRHSRQASKKDRFAPESENRARRRRRRARQPSRCADSCRAGVTVGAESACAFLSWAKPSIAWPAPPPIGTARN